MEIVVLHMIKFSSINSLWLMKVQLAEGNLYPVVENLFGYVIVVNFGWVYFHWVSCWLRSVVGYLGRGVVLFWVGAWRGGGQGVGSPFFGGFFYQYWGIFCFGRGGLGTGYHSVGFVHFPDISEFPGILSLKWFGNS